MFLRCPSLRAHLYPCPTKPKQENMENMGMRIYNQTKPNQPSPDPSQCPGFSGIKRVMMDAALLCCRKDRKNQMLMLVVVVDGKKSLPPADGYDG
jgi:hypothetical protein